MPIAEGGKRRTRTRRGRSRRGGRFATEGGATRNRRRAFAEGGAKRSRTVSRSRRRHVSRK